MPTLRQDRVECRLNRLLLDLPEDRFRAWRLHLQLSATAAGLRRATVPVALATRPWWLPEATLRNLHRAARRVESVLQRLPWLRRHDPRVRSLLPLGDEESRWLERYAQPAGRDALFTRLDARLGADGFVFLGLHGPGAGGVTESAAAAAAMAEVLPEIAPDLPLRHLSDARDLLAAELRSRAFARRRPRVALLEDHASLVEHLEARGFTAEVAHPAELREGADGAVLLHGRPVDAVFRDQGLRRLAAMQDRLDGLRRAFERGLVVPGTSSDLDGKATFELLSSPEFEPFLRDDEVEACRKHVAWTRLLTERRTTGRRDEPIDLPRYALRHREDLVLKPDRSGTGEDVIVGPFVSQADWEQAVSRALEQPGGSVVQSYQTLAREEFAEPGGGLQERYLAAGVFATAHGLAIVGHAGAEPVVDLGRGAGVVPVMVQP